MLEINNPNHNIFYIKTIARILIMYKYKSRNVLLKSCRKKKEIIPYLIFHFKMPFAFVNASFIMQF